MTHTHKKYPAAKKKTLITVRDLNQVLKNGQEMILSFLGVFCC